jgi:hypothetical protein
MDSVRNNDTRLSVHGHKTNSLKFADDIDVLEEDRDELQENLGKVDEAGEASGLQIHLEDHEIGV